MKAKHANAPLRPGAATIKYIFILFAAGATFFACKKNAEAVAIAPPVNDIENMAGIVHGETLTGSIVANDDENTTTLVFNSGTKYVLIEKIPGMPTEDIHAIQSAMLITSKYGVIVKDVTNNKVFLLANNDEESLQKFETIKQQLHCSVVSTTIFGTTFIDAAKS
jgi:hypothetical protein